MAEKTGTDQPDTEGAGAAAGQKPVTDSAVSASDLEGGNPQQDDAVTSDPEADSLDPLELAARLQAASAQIETLQDQALRSQAEAENTRRRTAREAENARKFALEKFAQDLLPVMDSLEKAIESAESTGASDPISEGVKLSVKLFQDVLSKAGIEQIDPHGEPFDPQLHEAMAMVPNPDAEPNSVMEVMQKGYTLNGRLVRAAMVVVSKAP